MTDLLDSKGSILSPLKEALDNVFQVEQLQKKPTILIVDDEIDNLRLLERTFRTKYKILKASDGVEALEVVKKNGQDIALILTDQRMPKMTGVEFLKEANNIYPNIIKMIITGYSDINDIIDAVNTCGLYQYCMKPFEPSELEVSVYSGIQKYLVSTENITMLKDLKELFYKTLKSISAALDAKDPYTHGHSLRVTLYSLILARELNLDDKMLEEIEIAGLLHDIGKIGIPQNILCKPGKLTDEEFAIMKSHPQQGEKMLNGIKQLALISIWLKTHHERWDGKGYPLRLEKENIPLSARIIALADTYDAMTSTRSYRKALSHEMAIEEIKRCAGSQFDPDLAFLFVKIEDKIAKAKENPEKVYYECSNLKQNMELSPYSQSEYRL